MQITLKWIVGRWTELCRSDIAELKVDEVTHFDFSRTGPIAVFISPPLALPNQPCSIM
jgi:hypothetical protein